MPLREPVIATLSDHVREYGIAEIHNPALKESFREESFFNIDCTIGTYS